MTASTAATTAETTARRRKYSTRPASSARRASHTRYTEARYAATTTPSTPVTSDVGLSQLCTGSPAFPPAGTCPDAMPPAIAPMQKGTSTDDRANAPPKTRWYRVESTALRNAKLAPRSTMPSAAIVSGTNIVSTIDWYAVGKPDHVTTKMKISQTWFASHTGPIDRS